MLQVVIPVMGVETVQCNQFKDELSLSYISNKSIVPVGKDKMYDVDKVMDSGM